jgi:hypothetical protein
MLPLGDEQREQNFSEGFSVRQVDPGNRAPAHRPTAPPEDPGLPDEVPSSTSSS